MEGLQDILKRHLDNVKERIVKEMAENNRNASGKSVASLNVVVDGNEGILYGSKSFLVMERGKKPGKVPYGFRDIIKQWIIDKGISVNPIPAKRQNTKYTPYERGLNSMAGAIAYKIMKDGTSLYCNNGFNDIYTTAINEELEELQKEIVLVSINTIANINNDF